MYLYLINTFKWQNFKFALWIILSVKNLCKNTWRISDPSDSTGIDFNLSSLYIKNVVIVEYISVLGTTKWLAPLYTVTTRKLTDGELCKKTPINDIYNTKKFATSNTGPQFPLVLSTTRNESARTYLDIASVSLLPSVQFRINHVLPGAAFSSARPCSRYVLQLQ